MQKEDPKSPKKMCKLEKTSSRMLKTVTVPPPLLYSK